MKGLIWNEQWTSVKTTQVLEASAQEKFRQDVMDTVRDIEDAYWALIANDELVRVADLFDPIEQGERRPEGEQDQGHHEGPEVPLPAVAERVLRGRWPFRGPVAPEEQGLIGGVGDRVDGLGEHRGRARDREPDELCDGDSQVGEERRDDRFGSTSGCHGRGE